MRNKILVGSLVIAVVAVAVVFAFLPSSSSAPPETHQLQAERVFDGTALGGWQRLGSSAWKVDHGNIVGSARAGDSVGGWLVLDRVYQDFVFKFDYQCSGCDIGLLLRSTKAGEGMSGIYFPLSGAEAGGIFRVALDAQGKIIDQKQFAVPASQIVGDIAQGTCAPIPCEGIRDAHGGAMSGTGVRPAVKITPREHDWNQIEITMRGDVIIALANGTRLGTVKWDGGSRFGKLALRAASATGTATTTEARFKDLSLLDLTQRAAGVPAEATGDRFRKQQLSGLFYAYGVAGGDLNNDGIPDVQAGPFYYLGPDFKVARELYPPATINVEGFVQSGGPEQPQAGAIVHGSYPPHFQSYIYDLNGDGWKDVVMVMAFGPRPTFSGHVFINPRGESRHWDNYEVIKVVPNEINPWVDIDGDGRPELIGQLGTRPDWTDNQWGYWKPDWSNPTTAWSFTAISEKRRWGGHGGGVGDVNGDGRPDIVGPLGWWEQPPAGTASLWRFHQVAFGRPELPTGPGSGGSDMSVYDVNGDGLADVITSIAAHGPGLAWFEQKEDGVFERHDIMGAPEDRKSLDEVAFAELHSLTYADIDGDGLQDVIAGKDWYSHGFVYQENEIDNPPVLYWFRLVRNPKAPGGAEFIPEMIHNNSGVGHQFTNADMNGDGAPDILTSARKGTFIFFNNTRNR